MKFQKRLLLPLFVLVLYNAAGQTVYDTHLQAAQRSGIPLIQNNSQLNALVSKKKLVKVGVHRGYTIARLTHSKPYLTPRSYKVLKDLGNTFYTRSKKKTFTVTSVTRTLYDQKRLSRINTNAVTTKPSSHNYGCSFDISYIRFNNRKAPNTRLEKLLETILTEYQKQGKLYFIKEYREKCFHITVR
ncbi:hypothetical protein PIECOFPK_00517 [Mycovorax composti]|jgi:hypothetical protein|uniref:Uncharacterized protein n=2 Tax=Chitinophagaceae TaxID=563835 RepID=A0ABZ2EH23_9BACT